MTILCYRQLAEALTTEGAVVLATVIGTTGSVPREVGAKMIICKNGRIFDTIGGGAGEAKVIEQAMGVLETGKKQLVQIDLSGSPQRQTQGICGGSMQVWLELWAGSDAIALVKQILDLLQSGETVTLVTPFASDQSPYLSTENALSDSFQDTIYPPPTLLIVGAGHVGEQLAKVAYLAGFQIVVQDDRLDWANEERYPQSSLICNESINNALSKLASHTELYVALVTRGYQYDLEALELMITREFPCKYIGMIGSEKRVRMVYQAIEKAGIDRNKFKSIYAPIGLDIGALTPAEIAVSICAELILVRRGGKGHCLSQHLRQQI